MCKRALAIQEETLAPGDPQIAVILGNLVSIYRSQRRFAPALELSRRAERILRDAYGDRHPVTCLSANKLAVLLSDLGRLDEAEYLFSRTLQVQTDVLGEDSPDTAITMANLAALSFRLKMHAEAESLTVTSSPCLTALVWTAGGWRPSCLTMPACCAARAERSRLKSWNPARVPYQLNIPIRAA
jgi:tetratricopeptide (TPR) repeat protein